LVSPGAANAAVIEPSPLSSQPTARGMLAATSVAAVLEVIARVAMRVGSGEMTESQMDVLKKEREKLRAKTPPNTESKA
jgi:hypothetical protein